MHTTEPPFLESELRVVENQLTSRDRPLRWNSQPSQTPSRCLPDENIQPVLVEPILPPVQDQGNSHITDIGPHDNRSELAAEQHGEIDQTSWRPLDGEDDWPPYTFGGRTPQPPSESSYWSDRSPYHTGYPDSFNFEPFVEAQIPFNDEHHDSRTLGYRSTSPGSGEGFQDGNEPTGSSYQPNPSNHEELYMSNEWENLSNASTLVSPPSPQTEPTQPTTSSTEVLMPLIDSNDETANTALSTNLASHVAGRPRPMRWALSMSTADVSYSPNGDGSLNWSPSPDRPQPEHYAVPLISPYFLDEDEIPVWLRPHGGLLQQARDDTPIEQSVTETSTAHHAPAKKESGQEKQTSLETKYVPQTKSLGIANFFLVSEQLDKTLLLRQPCTSQTRTVEPKRIRTKRCKLLRQGEYTHETTNLL